MSGSKTKQTTQSTRTSTPNPEQWVRDSVQQTNARVNDLTAGDPQSFVAGPSALQEQAFQRAGTLGQNRAQQGLRAAAAAGGLMGMLSAPQSTLAGDPSRVEAASLLQNLERYQNPFQEQVVQNTMARAQEEAARQMARAQAQGAAAGAFGGSRFGLQQALLGAEQQRNIGDLVGQLNQRGFEVATSLSGQDAARRQAAAESNAAAANQFALQNMAEQNAMARFAEQQRLANAGLLGQLSSQMGDEERANAGLVADLGNVQRGIAQERASAPLTLADALTSIQARQPYGMFVGQTETGSSTTNQTSNPGLLGALTGAASLFAPMGSALGGLAGIARVAPTATQSISAALRPISMPTGLASLPRF